MCGCGGSGGGSTGYTPMVSGGGFPIGGTYWQVRMPDGTVAHRTTQVEAFALAAVSGGVIEAVSADDATIAAIAASEQQS